MTLGVVAFTPPASGIATTEGTRFEPSSPGMTTGCSPCMKATSELVVPRSIPITRSSDISILVSLNLKRLIDAVHEVANVPSPVKQRCELFLDGQLLRFVATVDGCVPFFPKTF